MKVISYCSVKGGTGKSSLSIVTALSLRRQGHSVLFVDLDPQNSGTFFFTADNQGKSVFNALLDTRIGDNILPTEYGVDLLPSDLRLLDCRTIETNRLKKILSGLPYDFAIIDTAPTYDSLTTNAYLAADTIIIPSTVDAFSHKTCHFLINKLEGLDVSAQIGIALNMFAAGKSDNPKLWSNREAALFFDDDRLKDYLITTTIPRSQTMHRIIAETGYMIRGKTAENIVTFIKEITDLQLTINSVGGAIC